MTRSLLSETVTLGLPPRDTSSVCGVIVTYNPAPTLLENVAALRPQVNSLAIVDNGSDSASLEIVDHARREFECEVILNGCNLGIAAALNAGVRYAESQNYDWVALFDQDSTVAASFVGNMLRTAEDHEDAEKIAILAPRYIDRESLVPMPLQADNRTGRILANMTSGSMIPLNVFRRCDFFDESLFMDYVDHEFCLRVRNMGFVIVQSKTATLLHSLGARSSHELLGRTFVTTNHRAARRYYMTRNRMWLYKKYLWTDFAWTVRDARSLLIEIGKILLVEEDRRLKLHHIALGFKDALAGHMGHRITL